MRKVLKFILGFFTIFVCNILSKFIIIRFTHIFTTRIGHQTMNFDAATLSVKKKTIILISYDKNVANEFIFNFFKKTKKTFFSRKFRYILQSIFFVNPMSKLIIDWDEYQPAFSRHLQYKPKIIIPHYSPDKLKDIFDKLNIHKDFVGLHARNNLYVNEVAPEDKNYHEFRNFEFEDFKLGIDYLENKKNTIIKLGKTYPNEDLSFTKTNIITSRDYNYNDEIDYLINMYSKFNVIGNSGVVGISTMIRKRVLYVNFIPLSLDNLSYCSPGSVILPKKIFNKNSDKYIKFNDNENLSDTIHLTHSPYDEKNLEVVNNSAQEILNAIQEMDNIIDNKSYSYINDCEYQEEFWKSFGKQNVEKTNYLKNTLKLTISPKFLNENSNLI